MLIEEERLDKALLESMVLKPKRLARYGLTIDEVLTILNLITYKELYGEYPYEEDISIGTYQPHEDACRQKL